jgi:hypothetical protein
MDLSQIDYGRETTTELLHRLYYDRKEQERKLEAGKEDVPDVGKDDAWWTVHSRTMDGRPS